MPNCSRQQPPRAIKTCFLVLRCVDLYIVLAVKKFDIPIAKYHGDRNNDALKIKQPLGMVSDFIFYNFQFL